MIYWCTDQLAKRIYIFTLHANITTCLYNLLLITDPCELWGFQLFTTSICNYELWTPRMYLDFLVGGDVKIVCFIKIDWHFLGNGPLTPVKYDHGPRSGFL